MADEAKKGFKIGPWAFVIGLILAIIFALISGNTVPQWAVFVLAILGIIVGLLNVTGREAEKFLIAAVAFLLSFSALSNVFTVVVGGWPAVGTFFSLLNIFIAPAAAIVAIKVIFGIAKD